MSYAWTNCSWKYTEVIILFIGGSTIPPGFTKTVRLILYRQKFTCQINFGVNPKLLKEARIILSNSITCNGSFGR